MFTQDVVKNVKSASVAIGILDKITGNFWLTGSGFLFDPRGYVATAGHVLRPTIRSAEIMNQNGKNVGVAMFRIQTGDHHMDWIVNLLDNHVLADKEYVQEDDNLPLQEVWDVGISKASSPPSAFPYLKLADLDKFQILDEIAMCGYPQGDESLRSFVSKNAGQRFSPIIQVGKISALLPYDDVEEPYGLQTDIFGTGGSSGSPFVNNKGEVIGIALKVIRTYGQTEIPKGKIIIPDSEKNLKMNEEDLKFHTESNTGLVFGYTNFLLNSGLEDTRTYFTTGIKKEFSVMNITKLDTTS